MEYDQNSNITAKYTHGPNIDEPLAVQQGTAIYYYHADGLGSITGLSNTSGTIVQTYSYDSFGNMTSTGSISQPFTYTGREYDQETGMYFYRARYYDPKVGRFVTKDPISFNGGDVNLYAYVKNDPINLTDPEGELIFQAIGVATTAYALFKAGLDLAEIKRLNKDRDRINCSKCESPWPEDTCNRLIPLLEQWLREIDQERRNLAIDALKNYNPETNTPRPY
jgi:RHS repeat-associated protein